MSTEYPSVVLLKPQSCQSEKEWEREMKQLSCSQLPQSLAVQRKLLLDRKAANGSGDHLATTPTLGLETVREVTRSAMG